MCDAETKIHPDATPSQPTNLSRQPDSYNHVSMDAQHTGIALHPQVHYVNGVNLEALHKVISPELLTREYGGTASELNREAWGVQCLDHGRYFCLGGRGKLL